MTFCVVDVKLGLTRRRRLTKIDATFLPGDHHLTAIFTPARQKRKP
jgi:hypothetical protein